MPGTLKQAAPPLNSGASTECTWTLDSAPTYRVLQVQLQAYSPSGLASGNGSATFAAEDAYQSFENGFTSPGPKSGQPKATVTDLSGMPGGTQTSAFQATQVFTRGGATTDVANVFVRYRNVIITVVVDGLDQTSGGKKYGPVAMSDLTAEANAVANGNGVSDRQVAPLQLPSFFVLLLGLDTATPAVTVALHDGVQPLAQLVTVDAHRHAELLAPAIAKAIADAGAAQRDLTGIVAGVGPGPYTGLRVGLVTARVLGAALGIPVYGLCSLDAIAADVAAGGDDGRGRRGLPRRHGRATAGALLGAV